ncbi:MAG: P-loop NTPase [Chloroflexi bacterium]|nr:P-loop NTPase [Chloroflexota bacterium]
MSAGAQDEVRVLLAVGDRELEGRLQRELPEAGIAVRGRCLDGPSLLELAAPGDADAVLAAADLHRLTEETLRRLAAREIPVVLLAQAGDAARLSRLAGTVPASSPAPVVAEAVRRAVSRGARPAAPAGDGSADAAGEAPGEASRAAPRLELLAPPGSGRGRPRRQAAPGADAGGRVVAVVSGKGAPGKTTLAISLAALFAEGGSRTVLLDADLRGGNVAPYLDLDPRRGLLGLASPGSPLSEELQLTAGFAVVAGLERPALAAGLREETVPAAVAALRGRFETVVVDLSPMQPGLLRPGDELLLVTGADLVSVWNARTALPAVREQAGGSVLTAAVNRRDGRDHYDAPEVGPVLGLPVSGVVREDRESARRAVQQQIPLVRSGGRVAADLGALARGLGADVDAPPEPRQAFFSALLPGLAGGR